MTNCTNKQSLWKDQLIKGATGITEENQSGGTAEGPEISSLHRLFRTQTMRSHYGGQYTFTAFLRRDRMTFAQESDHDGEKD